MASGRIRKVSLEAETSRRDVETEVETRTDVLQEDRRHFRGQNSVATVIGGGG